MHFRTLDLVHGCSGLFDEPLGNNLFITPAPIVQHAVTLVHLQAKGLSPRSGWSSGLQSKRSVSEFDSELRRKFVVFTAKKSENAGTEN